MVVRDEPHAAHVGGEAVDVVEATLNIECCCCLNRVAQVEQQELVRGRRLELRLLDINAPDPVPLVLQSLDEMVANEATRAGYKNSIHEHPLPIPNNSSAASIPWNPDQDQASE